MNDKSMSKFLSLVLRHKPDKIGLILDSEGWADVDYLIKNIVGLTLPRLEKIVAEDDKQRYSFNKNKTKIKANQGHSISVDLKLKPIQPPALLYHGTSERNQSPIERSGILKMSRQHVHLSDNYETAAIVGKRHGQLLVYAVNANQMHKDGYKFYLSENNVWLTDNIPPKYIKEFIKKP